MCDAACRAKILLNGARVIREIEAHRELIHRLEKSGVDVSKVLTKARGYKVIAALDQVEDLLIELNDLLLDSTGYKRKTPKFRLD